MKKIRIVESQKEFSPVLVMLGITLLIIRLRSYMEFQTDYYFEPEVSHISYMISFLTCFAMIASFRQPVLNAVPFVVLPSFLITIPFWDIPTLMRAAELPPWQIVNALTIHIPCLIIGIWIFINRKELVSINAIGAAVGFGIPYFIFVDNKVNDVGLNGTAYTTTVGIVATIWIILLFTLLLKNSRMVNTFSARLIVLKLE
jgi:hypothetical protein